MKDVSAVVHLSPTEILWKLPLADGLRYQREHWLSQGVKLIRRSIKRGETRSARSFFRE